MRMYVLFILTTIACNVESCSSLLEGDYPEGEVEVRSQDRLHWPYGIVRYTTDIMFTPEQEVLIDKAMTHIEHRTCILFIPRRLCPASTRKMPEKTLFVMRGPRCSCRVGYQRYGSSLYLHPNCFLKVGTVVHELLHALGLRHEHQRWDRNYYIHINYTNIMTGRVKNFRRRSRALSYITSAGLPYDYNSIMHYGPNAFARHPAWPVLSPLCNCAQTGQRMAMSPTDVARVNRLYNCTKNYLGDDIPNAVPFYQWKKHVTMLRRREARHRW